MDSMETGVDGNLGGVDGNLGARLPSGERIGLSPLKLATLRWDRKQLGSEPHHQWLYDVSEVDREAISTLLESAEGKHLEWCDGKLIQKVESLVKDTYATWLGGGFFNPLADANWNMCRNTHVVTNLGVFIPYGSATHWPSRPRLPREVQNPMSGNTLPHWVCEVKWASIVDSENLGFSKITDIYFAAVGPDNTHIEEGWVISVPDDNPKLVLNELPFEQQEEIQPQQQRPPPHIPFLAILQREVPLGSADHVRAYFPLLPNTIFRVPDYSVLSAAGAYGGAGTTTLVVNRVLKNVGYNIT